MLTTILSEKDLPFEELREIGLMEGEAPKLEKKDVMALLTGNRTSLLTLKNFNHQGMEIKALNVKLSLVKNALGSHSLLYHPVYKQAVYPPFISASESDDLITGLKANIVKEISTDGQQKEVMVEYDQDTKEFVMTDTLKIKAPHQVDRITLSPYQKQRYSSGREIELDNGTKIQASSSCPEGIRSNRLAIVVSLLMDGGISYLLLQGLKALNAGGGKTVQSAQNAPEFEQAKKLYDSQQSGSRVDTYAKEQSNLPARGYTRSGMSR